MRLVLKAKGHLQKRRKQLHWGLVYEINLLIRISYVWVHSIEELVQVMCSI